MFRLAQRGVTRTDLQSGIRTGVDAVVTALLLLLCARAAR